MKPEDQKAFEAEFAETLGDYPRNWALRGFHAALAHRDAHTAVAVNEQMLEALKAMDKLRTGPLATYDETEKAWALVSPAIRAAEAAKKGVQSE